MTGKSDLLRNQLKALKTFVSDALLHLPDTVVEDGVKALDSLFEARAKRLESEGHADVSGDDERFHH